MRHPELDAILEKSLISTAVTPGAQVALATKKHARWVVATGAAGFASLSRRERVTPETLYDLASISKPFLAILVADLIEAGWIGGWDVPLGALLREAAGRFAEQSTIESLLSHQAGLMAHLNLFAPLREKAPISIPRLLETAAAADRGATRHSDGRFDSLYSDLGYLLLAKGLEQRFDRLLDDLLEERIAAPNAIQVRSARLWSALEKTLFAATEQCLWRGGETRGHVHDENAWALSGHGFSGHAGLFGNALALLRLGTLLCDARQGTQREVPFLRHVHRLTRRCGNGTFGCGFDLKKPTGTSAFGSLSSSNTFGHLGFTGTSLLCDPERQVVVALLTNRVNLRREPNRLAGLRPDLHDQLLAFGGRAT